MTSISKDEYIDKLNDIVNECNNIYENEVYYCNDKHI